MLFPDDRRQISSAVLAALGQCNLDVCQPANITVRTAHGRRTNTLHTRRIVGNRMLYVETVEIDINVFFGAQVIGVLNRRPEQLLDLTRDSLLGKRERVEGVFDALSLDQV